MSAVPSEAHQRGAAARRASEARQRGKPGVLARRRASTCAGKARAHACTHARARAPARARAHFRACTLCVPPPPPPHTIPRHTPQRGAGGHVPPTVLHSGRPGPPIFIGAAQCSTRQGTLSAISAVGNFHTQWELSPCMRFATNLDIR